MSFGITKTIPAGESRSHIDALYDGSISQHEFHMAGTPARLHVGDFVYTIYHNELIGRLRIKHIEAGAVNPKSGKPRTLIIVEAPGDRLPLPIPKQGHQGTRYTDGADWPSDLPASA